MTDDELIGLEHENWIAYLTGVVSRTSRANVTRAGGVVTILTALPFDWFNQILVEHEEATPDGVRAGVARTREQGDRSSFVCARESMIDSSRPCPRGAGARWGGDLDARHGRDPDRAGLDRTTFGS